MKKRILFTFVSVLLAVIIGVQTPVVAFAESSPVYLKELQIAVDKDASKAKAKLKDAGYTVIDQNLKESSGGSCVYMGYKTTENKKEAISDIRMANMNSGIENLNYGELAKRWHTNIDKIATDLKLAYSEIKTNYEAKSPLAVSAVEMLNVFDVDGVKLGEYLMSSKRTLDDFEDILLMCSSDMVNVIYYSMFSAVADYNSDGSNFATRLSKINASEYTVEKLKNNKLYACYDDTAVDMLEALQKFRLDYETAVDELTFYDEDKSEEENEVQEMSDEEQIEFWEKYLTEDFENSEDEDEQNAYYYATIICAYKTLESYDSFSKEFDNLGEYILACGEDYDPNDQDDYDVHRFRVYPLVTALTAGQRATLKMAGLTTLISTLSGNNSSNRKKIENVITAIKNSLKENEINSISVFYNVNRDIYSQNVGLTADTARVTRARDDYVQLTKVEEEDQLIKNCTQAVRLVGAAACATLGSAILISIGISFAVGLSVISAFSVGYTAILAGSIAVAATMFEVTTGVVVASIVGVAFVAVALIALAIVVICVIIAIFKKIFSDDDDEPEIVYTDIPEIMFDKTNNKYVQYKSVNDTDGNPCDINDNNGKQWDAVYYTKSTSVGSPIRVEDGHPFIVQINSAATPNGYVPLKRFGYKTASDFNAFDSGKTTISFFYKTEDSINGVVKIKENDGKYLYDLEFHTESSAEACLAYYQQQEKYSCIEVNITPNSGKCTYIGYQTTNDPDEAITDLRAVYGYSANKLRFGVDSNGKCVEYSSIGTAANDVSVFYTKSSNNGTPIYANLFITTDKTNNPAPSGWEPVNMFSGGDAFDFGFHDGKQTIGKSVYIYFQPTETYTQENSQEYVSGFCFVNGANKADSKCDGGFNYLENYGEHFGYKLIDSVEKYDLTVGATLYNTYMMMSTTYNPYRAISDAATYTASCTADGVSKSIAVGVNSYAVCETFYQEKDVGLFRDDMYLHIRASNGYVTKHTQEGAVEVLGDSGWKVQNEEGNSDNIRVKGFYVAGPVKYGSTAVLVSDIHFSKDYAYYRDTSGEEIIPYRPVHDITEPYTTAGDNLTFEYESANEVDPGGLGVCTYYPQYREFKNHLYMSIKGNIETRGKYVSGIYGAYSSNEDGYSDDEAILSLLSLGKGEIIRTNLAVSSGNQSYTYDSSTGQYSYNSKNGKTSYILVTYTDTLANALKSTVTKWYSSEKDSQDRKITVKGANYTKGGEIIKSLTGYYSLYNSANTQLGQPVTLIKIDTDPYTDFAATVIGADGSGHTNEEYYIKLVHSETNLANSYVNKFIYVTGSSRLDCAKQLLEKGCSVFIDRNKNEGLKGYLYFGYDTTSDEKDSSVLTDMKIKYSDSDNLPDSYEENGATYTKVSENLNSGVGGKYTYLYTTNSDTFKPISVIDITQHMSRELKYYKYLYTQTWYKLDNAAQDSGKYCNICFKRASEWTLSKKGNLDISYNGSMPNFTEKYKIRYVNAYGGTWKTVNFYPEWTEYCDKIKTVTIEKSVTNINALAFYNCTNLQSVTVLNDDIEIAEGAIPEGVTLYAHYGSATYNTAKSMGITCEYIKRFSGSCGTGASYTDCGDSVRIYGNGEVTSSPWKDETDISDVYIENGIIKIYSTAFEGVAIETLHFESKDCVIEDGAINKDVKIYCYKNSTAYKYAVANGNKYTLIADATGGNAENILWTLYDDTLEITGNGELQRDEKWDEFCRQVKTVTIKGEINVLGNECFKDFENLQTITTETAITSIGTSAFANCYSLEDKLISLDSLTSIGDGAYTNCTKLEFIRLGSNVVSVGSSAFENAGNPAKQLHIVVTNKSCTIGDNAVPSNGILHTYKDSAAAGYKPANDAKVYVYKDFDINQSAGENVYWGITDDGTFNLFGYNGTVTEYTGNFSEIPTNIIKFYPWGKYIEEDIRKVNILDGIACIPRMGFQGAINLTELSIGSDVTIIKDYAFYDTCISNIVIPSTVSSVYDYAFFCYETASQNMTVLNARCMLYYNLTESKTTTVYGLDGSTAKIYASKVGAKFVAITNTSAVPSVTTSKAEETTKVNEEATTVKAETTTNTTESVTEKSATKDEMTWTVEDGELIISGDCKMTDYTADVLAPWYAEVENITSVTVSDGITSIGDYAFDGLLNVTKVSIADSVTSVGDYAFSNNKSLKEVTIPEKVESIGEGTFSGCDSLETITVKGESPDISRAGLSNVSKIVSPQNSLAYQYALENNIEVEDYTQNIIGTAVTQLGQTKMIIALSLLLCFIAAFAVIYKKKNKKEIVK